MSTHHSLGESTVKELQRSSHNEFGVKHLKHILQERKWPVLLLPSSPKTEKQLKNITRKR
jgi:hypothetical protein